MALLMLFSSHFGALPKFFLNNLPLRPITMLDSLAYHEQHLSIKELSSSADSVIASPWKWLRIRLNSRVMMFMLLAQTAKIV